MRLESLEYARGEFEETGAMDELGKSLDTLLQNIKASKIVEANKEKFFDQFEKIQWAITPILAKSSKFGLDQYNAFGELARKTNYSAHDTSGRTVIMLSDTFTSLLAMALMDTKEYLEDLNKNSL